MIEGDERARAGPMSPRRRSSWPGYTLIRVNSREEAIEWTKRFPNPAGQGKDAEIEVRQLFELEDFAPGDAVDRFGDMGLDSNR